MAAQAILPPSAGSATQSVTPADAPPFHAMDWPQPVSRAPAPLLCAAWAEAIACYWTHLAQTGALDAQQPFYLLDLAPGNGAVACHLLNALMPWLDKNGFGSPPLRYLMCADSQVECEALLAHPSLARHVECGALTAVLRHELPVRGINPLVILAWDYFSTLPSELHGVHYGVPMSASMNWESAVGAPGALSYGWTRHTTSATTPDAAEVLRSALLTHYAERCNTNCVLLPLEACAMLERAAALGDGRYLMLASDVGLCNEQQLRRNACAPPPAWPAPGPLPLNVHGLALAQAWQGARTWQRQLSDAGHVLHMAMRGGGHVAAQADIVAFDSIQRALTAAHPDDSAQLVALAASWQSAQAVAMAPIILRLCAYDPAVLRACLPALLADGHVEAGALSDWHDTLEQVWQRYLPSRRYDDFARMLAGFASYLGHFGLARACLHASLAWYGDDAGDLHQLALCELSTGRSANAAAMLAHALTLDPGHADCLALRSQMMALIPEPDAPQPTDDASGLTLEALHAGHAAALLHQYRDPQIAVMTCLPQFDNEQQVRDWIEHQRATEGKISFAVMHSCWGFVGMVCLHCAGDKGYFYFWIGCDFQGRGYGPAAAALLWPYARQLGIRAAYTSVYTDNARSRRALELLSFEPLPVRAEAPDDALLFLGKALDEQPVTRAQLLQLCVQIDSPIQFIPFEEADYSV